MRLLPLIAGLLAISPPRQVRQPPRVERVLSLLRDLEQKEGSWHYHDTSFVPVAGEDEGPLAPSYSMFCATGSQDIDSARFRKLALEVMRIYDLSPSSDVLWRLGEARLDGLDLEQGIGFELRDRDCAWNREDQPPGAKPEALDDLEVARLNASGMRIYVADSGCYSDDGDVFTPALAFLGGLVRFLNEVTEGDDVDLGGLLFQREATWVWHFKPAEGMKLEGSQSGFELVVERAGTISIPCEGLSDYGPARSQTLWFDDPQPPKQFVTSTRGSPSAVVPKYSVRSLEPEGQRPRFRSRYRQTLDGKELVHESSSFVALLPGTFDLAQPFELELELSPGSYFFYGGSAVVGASARPR